MFILITILTVLISLILSLVLFLKSRTSYWLDKKIPFISSDSIVGNFKDVFFHKVSAAESMQKMYNHKIAKSQPIVGIYTFFKPMLIIRDPELIKRILIKDFNKFSSRYSRVDPHVDVLGSYNMFFAKYPIWKDIRSHITPVFTSGKLKQILSLVNKVGNQMDKYFCSLPMDEKTNSTCLELKELCALYSTDVIASVAFGIDANSMKNPDGEFRKNGRKIFEFTPFRAFQFNIIFFLPQFVSFLRSRFFSKESTDFLKSTIQYAMSEREKSNVSRNDLIDILLALKKNDKLKLNKDLDDILVAQAAVFFSAGFETSSSAMSFALYELSKKPNIQEKLRKEIKEVLNKNNGEITYEAITEMEYLNMVIQEVLRLYPPLPFLDRECVLLKNENGYSLDPVSTYSVPNGMPVFIPIYAIHRDPTYFPDPDSFVPERFSSENKVNIVPYTYMPFGIGPRNCIGERLGLMQTRIGLISFFKNHYVRLSSKSHKTMKLEEKALIIQSKGGIYVDVIRDSLF